MTKRGTDQKKEGSKVKIFPVPFALEEIEENIIINSNAANKTSQEQLINQAFDLHLQGNCL